MQQLETYKLKHIGRDDAFGPDTLNANTDAIAEQLARLDTADAAEAARVDAALAIEETARKSEVTRLNGEIARIDAALVKFDCGYYDGNDEKTRKINLSFTPKAVYVGCSYIGAIYTTNGYLQGGVAVTGLAAEYSGTIVEIVENGFQVCYNASNSSANTSGNLYRWFAIG